tara:strand:- start:6914 stop:7543 length:630 start_codon:yes stop_codon:yes gene_type:complete
MLIISHRGYWTSSSEKNSEVAFKRSFDHGLGTETDLRLFSGKLIISHDQPTGKELLFDDLLEMMDGRNLPLALNIKEDGLGKLILKTLEKYKHTNYFTFDMSIPDLLAQMKLGLNIFSGLSEVIESSYLNSRTEGIWLDSFFSDWWSTDDLANFSVWAKKICVVSSELHGRSHLEQWNKIRNTLPEVRNKLILCTDNVEEAVRYFDEKD